MLYVMQKYLFYIEVVRSYTVLRLLEVTDSTVYTHRIIERFGRSSGTRRKIVNAREIRKMG